MPGTEMNVIVDVSVATIEALTAHQGICLPPKKYLPVESCRLPNQPPAKITPPRYAAMMIKSIALKSGRIIHRLAENDARRGRLRSPLPEIREESEEWIRGTNPGTGHRTVLPDGDRILP